MNEVKDAGLHLTGMSGRWTRDSGVPLRPDHLAQKQE